MTGSDRSYRHRRGDTRILQALLAGASYVEAARVAGVGERTVRRRMADPEFRWQLAHHRAELLAVLRRRTVALAHQALDSLGEVIADEYAPPAARIAAARTILERADPLPQRVVADVALATSTDGRSAREQLEEALDRARQRLGLDDEPVLAANGYRGNGDG
jgi:hypothetical protein